MIDNTMNEAEFSQLNNESQHIVIFKNQNEVIKLLNFTNGKVRRHDRELNGLKAVGIAALIWFSICMGTGIPFLPF